MSSGSHDDGRVWRIRFDVSLRQAAFIETADRIGIDVILRIARGCHAGPNGGLPDWVLDSRPPREQDPDYSRSWRWFGALGGQVGRFCGRSGRVVAIQLENELYDQPGTSRQ